MDLPSGDHLGSALLVLTALGAELHVSPASKTLLQLPLSSEALLIIFKGHENVSLTSSLVWLSILPLQQEKVLLSISPIVWFPC